MISCGSITLRITYYKITLKICVFLIIHKSTFFILEIFSSPGICLDVPGSLDTLYSINTNVVSDLIYSIFHFSKKNVYFYITIESKIFISIIASL